MMTVARFIKIMDSLANAGAIAATKREHSAWIRDLEGNDAIDVASAISRAEARAAKANRRGR